ncbi:diaminopropionate ammonia-lyase [Undibacterium terreum]|nr:diaminopropionate ammonia-lyase [Undibacterium terreum]
MPAPLPAIQSELFINPHCASDDAIYSDEMREVLSLQAYDYAERHISQWAGYSPTPLFALPELARRIGISSISYKDESGRFGLGSFKALGGAYAVARLLLQELKKHTGNEALSAADLNDRSHAGLLEKLTVTCATDGNHGRSVAWGAQRYGCRCIIYVHAGVSAGRVRAIEAYGAQVVRIAGNYDDSVRQAAADAEEKGYFVVSDTSYPGYLDVPRDVMQGYTVMVEEVIQQTAGGEHPTHIFVQGGVGGLAAAVCAHYWQRLAERRPKLIVVEPEKAACLYRSAVAGKPVAIAGELDTLMAGLACGEISPLAWRILETGAFAFQTVDDDSALFAMKMLASGDAGPALVAGESAVAGLAGCIAAACDPASRQSLGLNPQSRILLIGSEGATDPELYRRIVGRDPGEIG